MITIKEIFDWYKYLPKLPDNLTSIQKEKWIRDNSYALNRSFFGEILSENPTKIVDISSHEISTKTEYYLDYLRTINDTRYRYEQNKEIKPYLSIYFKLNYSNLIVNDKIYQFNKGDTVNISGIIEKIDWIEGWENSPPPKADYYLNISLSLKTINKTNPVFLHGELLDKKLSHISRGTVDMIRNNIYVFGGVCMTIGALLRGMVGCKSCLDETTTNGGMWADFNLFTGLFQGAIVGAIIGIIIGGIVGFFKSPK